jgi:putative ABC transport system permease protein
MNKVLTHLALAEFRHRPRAFLSLVFLVAIGLAGPVALESFRNIFESHMQSRGRELLGADLEISSRLVLPQESLEKVEAFLGEFGRERQARTLALFSMARVGERTRLVRIEAFENDYPFYGKHVLEHSGESNGLPSSDEVWVYPEILEQLGVKVGEKISIGSSQFKIADSINRDPQQGLGFGGIAPKVFMSHKGLERANLVEKGSTLTTSHSFKLKRDLGEEDVNRLNQLIADPSFRITIPNKASEQVSRAFQYLLDFLSLVSLVAFFLASVGIFYQVVNRLSLARKEMAVLGMIGLGKNQIAKVMIIQFIFVGVVGSLIGAAMATTAVPILVEIINNQAKLSIPWTLSTWGLMLAPLLGVVGTLLVSLPGLTHYLSLPSINLFQEESAQPDMGRRRSLISAIPFAIFCLVLSLYGARSFKVGGFFYLVFACLAPLLYAVAHRVIEKLGKRKPRTLLVKLSLRSLSRHRRASSIALVALTLATLLLTVIPQLELALRKELSASEESNRAALFLFDIQDEQKEGVEKVLADYEANILRLSPMVRARLLSVNGEPFKIEEGQALTREEEQEQRTRNRGLNLSFRDSLGDDEKVVEGRGFNLESVSNEIGEISLEKRYAGRMGILVGDELEFDILGVPVKGKVINLRSVRWTSFLPNFFVLFGPGILEPAPKTHLIAAKAPLNKSVSKLLADVSEQFPNVSVIDVARVLERMVSLLSQIVLALQVTAVLVFIVGLLVIASIVRHQLIARAPELALLGMIGLTAKRRRRLIVSEFMVIAALAALVGIILGLAVSLAASELFFNGQWAISWSLLLGLLLSVVLPSGLIAYLMARPKNSDILWS